MKKIILLFFVISALVVSSLAFASCTGGANTGSDSLGGSTSEETNFDSESNEESLKDSLKDSVSQSEPAESIKESVKESVKESTSEEEGYTIIFDSAGGTSVPSQKVLNGKKIKKPDTPTKVGYTFTGWFVADDEWNFLAYTVTDDMTLTAGWAANTYVISFDVSGGKALADMNVTYDSAYVLPVPEKDNGVFLGWELGGKVFENGVYTKTENITLTAKWGVAVSTITFDVAGGSAVSPMKVNYGESYVLPKSQKSGYVFAGWVYNGEIFKDGTILSGDITLVARWEGLNDIFKFESSEEGITITEYIGNATDVIVPAEINDQPVIAIEEGVFANNSSITSVIFDGTFENYTEKMFAGCSSLKSLTISGVFDKALWWLFGDSASSVPASFTEVSFALNSNYIDGSMFKTRDYLAEHTITYVIPYGVTRVENKEYSGWEELQSVVIPDDVIYIGDNAFAYCYNLTNIVISNCVTNISAYAFYQCKSLTSVIIPNSVTSIEYYAFCGCSNLINVIISDNVTSIGRSVFYDCTSLTSVTIPDGVTSIKEELFKNCSSLISLTIPDSVSNIDYTAFAGCNKNLYVKNGGIVYVDNWAVGVVNNTIVTADIKSGTRGIADRVFYECGKLTSVTIPSSVLYIGDLAFNSCSSLKKVTIPNSVISIGINAFNYCDENLYTKVGGVIYVDNWAVKVENENITLVTLEEGTRGIAGSVFERCSKLTRITIPSGVVSIGKQAFKFCVNLSNVVIPNSVISIEAYAFYGCGRLTNITIPDSVVNIKQDAFGDCDGLLSVVIPNSVKSIEHGAFYDCDNLTSVTISGNITSIGNLTFLSCDNLESVLFDSTSEKWKLVKKGFDWLNGTKVTAIKCSDGDVAV